MIKKFLSHINSNEEEDSPAEILRQKNHKRQMELDENYSNWMAQLTRTKNKYEGLNLRQSTDTEGCKEAEILQNTLPLMRTL